MKLPAQHELLLSEVSRKRAVDLRVNGALVCATDVIGMLDTAQLPDGTPFLCEQEGSCDSLTYVNAYLRDAAQQHAYPLSALRSQHAAALKRLIEYVRRTREPSADLVDVTRKDLIEYSKHRRRSLAPSSWNSELSIIGNFFRYAEALEWIARDPLPRWGADRRITIKAKESWTRRVRFLTEGQARLFLEVGLRGDGFVGADRPKYPERDFAFGLLLVSTGLRREEASLLLDVEVPATVAANGVHVFHRVGKGNRPREIWIADALATVVDQYRKIEREYVVQQAQRSLRAARRKGELIVAEVNEVRGQHRFIVDGATIRAEQLPSELRRRAVRIRADGVIDPVALFVMQGGHGPALTTFNAIFSTARRRVAMLGPHPDAPPSHLDVAPHILRHTYAVRMLATLMRHGRETTRDPQRHLTHPLLVVQELLGHADQSTTNQYLHFASRYSDQIPNAVRDAAISMIGRA